VPRPVDEFNLYEKIDLAKGSALKCFLVRDKIDSPVQSLYWEYPTQNIPRAIIFIS
jgi:hypothetical protein